MSWKKGMWFSVTIHVLGAVTYQTSQSSHRLVFISQYDSCLGFFSFPMFLSQPFFSIFSPQVFRKGVSCPVFFVASRGHHADIGGITPGSMPPHSTSLQQEGAVFTSFKLVTGGIFQEEGKRREMWVTEEKERADICQQAKKKINFLNYFLIN